jgi:hypothetical protein
MEPEVIASGGQVEGDSVGHFVRGFELFLVLADVEG